MARTSTDWHPEDIKAAVRKTKTTFDTLGRRAGLAGKSLSTVLRMPWPRGQAIIAGRIGVPPQAIWPSRYDEAGQPKRGLRAAFEQDKARRRAAHSQKHGRA